MRFLYLALAGALALNACPVLAQAGGVAEPAETASAARWVTLGTRGGPLASATRSQPANLLVHDGRHYLIDVGDGATGQLAKLSLGTAHIDAVFISHLHFDHTAGLAGILGLRWQTNAADKLTVYGPPGIAELVSGLVASMIPGTTAGYGVPGAPRQDPRDMAEVIELRDGAILDHQGMRVSVRNNSHYSFAPGSDLAQRFESLSYRFDLPGRSIVYTGDTGPSTAVEELARGADLLVAEMMDVEHTLAAVRRNSPHLPPAVAQGMERHLRDHHLLPGDVGRLASTAGVGAVVVTHFVGREPDDPAHLEYLREIAAIYDGPVVIANDMDAF
jgi:ribonuclease BN (tRNA processing enzyme)